MHKGHYGKYTGNAKWSKVTASNYDATKRDDEAHMEYLKEDVDYDNKHDHSDENMTADEKHISRLSGDLKYDEKNHGSPATQTVSKDGKSAYESPPEKTYIKEDDPTVYNEDGSVSRFSVMQGNDRQTNGPTSEMFGAKSKKQMRYEKIAQKAENAISQNKFNKNERLVKKANKLNKKNNLGYNNLAQG